MPAVADLTVIQNITQRLVDSHPVNWGYTVAAYTGNEIEGVASFNIAEDMNVPLDTAVDTNPNTLNWGIQSQGASIARRLLNHMFGRMSYNLRKVTDEFYAFMSLEKTQWALNAFKYDSGQLYRQNDICFTVVTISGVQVIKHWIRTSSSPLTISGVDPDSVNTDWTSVQEYGSAYPQLPVNSPGYRRSYSLVDLTGGGFLTTTWYPVVTSALNSSAVATPQDANTILTEIEAYVAGIVTGQANPCRASLSATVKTSGWNVASTFDSADYPTSAAINNQTFIDDVTGADLGIANSPIGLTFLPKGRQAVFWLRGGSSYGVWNSFGASFSVKTAAYDNGAGDPIISPQTSRQFAYNPLKQWGRFAVPSPVLGEDAVNKTYSDLTNIASAFVAAGTTTPALIRTDALIVDAGAQNTNVIVPNYAAVFSGTLLSVSSLSVNVSALGAAGAAVIHKLYATYAAGAISYGVTTGSVPGGSLQIGTFTYNSGSSPITFPFCAPLSGPGWDLIIDSNDKLNNFAACTTGVFNSVFVAAGTWNLTIPGPGASSIQLNTIGCVKLHGEGATKSILTRTHTTSFVFISGGTNYDCDIQGIAFNVTTTGGSGPKIFDNVNRVQNCIITGTVSGNSEGITNCKYWDNVIITISGTNASAIHAVRSCSHFTAVTATGIMGGTGTGCYGFRDCTDLFDCTGTGDGSTSTVGVGFGASSCINVIGGNYTGRGGSSSGNGVGLNSCNFVTNARGLGLAAGSGTGHGFDGGRSTHNCTKISACKTATFTATFADAGTANAAADTAAGGYNVP